MGLYNIPSTTVQVNDGSLRVPRAQLRPKITVIGYTDKSGLVVNQPYLLEDRNGIRDFYFADGTPSPMAIAMAEAYDGGAKSVEGVVSKAAASVTADEYYTALDETYDILKHTIVDFIIPSGVRLDTPIGTGSYGETRNFAYQMANFCYVSTVNFSNAIGFMGVVSPLGSGEAYITGDAPNLTQMEAWVTALEAFNTSGITGGRSYLEYDGVTDLDGNGVPDNYKFWATTTGRMPTGVGDAVTDALDNPVDIGAYVNITAMIQKTVSSIGNTLNPIGGYYYNNGAAAYCGFVSSLRKGRGPSNLVLPGGTPAANLSYSQTSRLSTARYVAITNKPDGSKLSFGVTGAHNINTYYRSDYVNLSTVLATHAAIEATRAVAEKFLGEPNSAPRRNALDNQVKTALGKLVEDGVLESFDSSVYSDPTMQLLGQVYVDEKLDVPLEIREIVIRVGLQPPGSTTE